MKLEAVADSRERSQASGNSCEFSMHRNKYTEMEERKEKKMENYMMGWSEVNSDLMGEN